MTDNFVLNFIGYSRLIICAAMCYFPMSGKLKISVKKLIVMIVSSLTLFSAAGAYISTIFNIQQNFIVLPACIFMFAAYYKTLSADIYECLFVFVLTASLACYPFHYAVEIDAVMNPDGSYELLNLNAELFSTVLFLIMAVIFYLVRKPLSEFVSNLKTLPLRKIFWIVPLFYTVMLIGFIPLDYNTIHTGRIIYIYPIIITVIQITQLSFIYLFHRITKETINNAELLRTNQILEFQAKRFESLKIHMEQTRYIRHDFRQQLRTINSLIETGNYDNVKKYLSEFTENINENEWESFCKNNAVDALAGYYSAIARSHGIKTDWSFDISEKLPVPEPVFCGMLGNLIENAIDGCNTLSDGDKIIHLSVQMPGSAIIVLVIENTFDGILKTDYSGKILSLKHDNDGIGLESARAIAEKYRGNIKIEYDDRSFRVSILLNSI